MGSLDPDNRCTTLTALRQLASFAGIQRDDRHHDYRAMGRQDDCQFWFELVWLAGRIVVGKR
jgi:hypothetical protein